MSFVESNISQTLETFSFIINGYTAIVDNVAVAAALASCGKLKSLRVNLLYGNCCFLGRNGLDGLRVLVNGCPLLAEVGSTTLAPTS